MNPYVSNMAYIPLDLLEGSLASVKTTLTVIPKTYGEDESLPICLYDCTKEGYIGVPIDWGLENYKHLQFEDRTSKGNGLLLHASKKIDPFHPMAPKGQDKFIEDMINACASNYTCMALAQTASGKTIAGLAVASYFNMRTLVIVDKHTLADQWIKEIEEKLGIPKSRIAKIAGKDSLDLKASICVGLVHTLVNCKFVDKFYSSFGVVIFDEVHAMGSRTFSQVIRMFDSTIKIGMTATDERGDNAEFCYRSTLGTPRAQSSAQSMNLTVHTLDYTGKPLWSDNAQLQLNQLTKDVERNRIIAEIVARLYKSGRQVLVSSDRIEHLEELMTRVINLGVPAHECGLYTGQKTVNKKRVKVKSDELNKIKKDAKIIFSTYGLCQKGLNIPRLDAGIDASPRATATQLVGRVRRLHPGKPDPIWITMRDRHSPIFQGYYRKRYKDYMTISADVKEGLPEWLLTL